MSETTPIAGAELSIDAIIFGMGFLRSPKARLSFGGEGTEYQITQRAREALNELLAAGYAEPAEPEDSVPGREYYRGTAREPSLPMIARDRIPNPLASGMQWPSFTLQVESFPSPS